MNHRRHYLNTCILALFIVVALSVAIGCGGGGGGGGGNADDARTDQQITTLTWDQGNWDEVNWK